MFKQAIADLLEGKVVQLRPRGNSMQGKINSGQLVTIAPLAEKCNIRVGSIVLCKVNGKTYLHLVKALRITGPGAITYQIGNNKGLINGWASKIYGIVVDIED